MVIAPVAAKIFLPKSEVHALDPVVSSISPAHDSTTESPLTQVRIHFSKPMDTGSVEQAFSITPPGKGIFSWSTNGDCLTFAPQGAGFAAGTIVTIRIADSARDSGFRKRLYAPFESRFGLK